MKNPELVKSTSGIRGVIGNGLDPVMITEYGCAFGTLLKKGKLVLGRDSRPSGDMVARAVTAGLLATGIDVIDIGIVPTPTVEIAITELKAAGGICVTASHNPAQWNALKFFNRRGEFITPAQYQELNKIFESRQYAFKPHAQLGQLSQQTGWVDTHIKQVLALETVNRAAIKRAKFTVVVDAINGAGSYALPALLEKLGVKVVRLNCEGNGDFVHPPEPRPKHLKQLSQAVQKHKADAGFACDPDADRLALVDETGAAISEELTLTLAVKQVLSRKKGVVVINLSTSSATADVARQMGAKVFYAKVGEANVVELMHEKRAVIGGEGNGGVIYPASHAGRDSLVAAALVLSRMAEEKADLSALVKTLPIYYTTKYSDHRPEDFARRLNDFATAAGSIIGEHTIDSRDGLRFDFPNGWLQIRTSNTEQIYRLIVETSNPQLTDSLIAKTKTYFS